MRAGTHSGEGPAEPPVGGQPGNNLADTVGAAVRRWRASRPRWTDLVWVAEANPAAPVETIGGLEAELVGRLGRFERRHRRRGRLGAVALRCWVEATQVRLVLSGETGSFQWVFPRRAGWGGVPRPLRRGRVILPAAPPGWRSRAWREEWEAACLVSRNPGIVEIVRGLLGQMPVAGVWSSPSPRRARQWLAHHPRCPLMVVDEIRSELAGGATVDGGSQLWLMRPGAWLAAGRDRAPVCLKTPVNAREFLVAARKICAGELQRPL